MGYIDDGMTDLQDIDEPIKVGNGDKARATKKGTLHLIFGTEDRIHIRCQVGRL